MMKKIIIFVALLLCSLGVWAQQTTVKTNLTIQKANPTLYLLGTAAVIDFYNNDITLTQSSNLLTLAGGNLSLGSNSLLMSGSLGATGSRILQGWMTNLEITNLPTINGGTLAAALPFSSYVLKSDTASMLTKYARLASPVFTGVPKITAGDTIATRAYARTYGGVGVVTIGDVRDEIADSLNVLRPSYVAEADTSAMLNHYILASEVETSYVGTADSAAMLANYLLDSETAAAVTGFAPNSGSITLSGADAITLTTSNVTSLTLPTTGILATTSNLAAYVEIVDSTGGAAGNYMPRLQTSNLVNDTIEARIAAGTVGVALADSNVYDMGYASPTFVDSRLGSGSGLSAERLPFIIGTTTGAPTTADSTIVHSAFAGKHIDLYRDGAKQYQNFTATNTVEGFRLNGSTITVYPLWQDNEQVLVDIIEPILWSYLSIEGEESSLLTGLSAYWKLDESSGSVLNDEMGVQNAALYGGVTSTDSKLGRSVQLNDTLGFIRVPYNTNVSPKGAVYSVSMWFKLDSLPSAVGRDFYLFQQNNTPAPWGPQNAQINMADDKIEFNTTNTAGTEYTVYSTSALSDSTWYHVVFVNRGNGQTLQMYVNGSDVSASAETFTGTVYEGLSAMGIGNPFGDSSYWFSGVLDEIGIWSVALTSGNVTTLYNSGNGRTHPF
jgi:hypothetical protein